MLIPKALRQHHKFASRWGVTIAVAALSGGVIQAREAGTPSALEHARTIIRSTQPLEHPRGGRLPVFVWRLQGLDAPTESELESVLVELDRRGIAAVTPWDYRQKEASLAAAIRMAAVQQRLGLTVAVNSTRVMELFFNADESTAHRDADGRPFFDDSFTKSVRMGCPFTLKERVPAIRRQVEYFVRAYRERSLPLDVVIGDWEVDGPIEWNDAWISSMKCTRCREHVPRIEKFAEFQAALRRLRSELTKRTYSDVILEHFPRALVGNYGVYPNDGYRYWYDFYERVPELQPFIVDQAARYRPWFQEFPLTGYTFAMPVLYPWYKQHVWYDYADSDYRWFYNLLLIASATGRVTPPETPLIPFVTWRTTLPPPAPDPAVRQFSPERYQELLWHMLLRGHDAFALYCRHADVGEETRLVQEVYRAALRYRDFLGHGTPVAFDVPKQQGPVISGLVLGSDVLVRRTDFSDSREPVALRVGSHTLMVPRLEGRCQVLRLPQR